jgi:hypothetical protein
MNLSFFISRQNEETGSNKGKKDASTILDAQAKRRDFFDGFPAALLPPIAERMGDDEFAANGD